MNKQDKDLVEKNVKNTIIFLDIINIVLKYCLDKMEKELNENNKEEGLIMCKKKDGFWVQYHIERRNSDKKEYGYNYYEYGDGYTKYDEESFKIDAQSWAENEKQMWAKDRYNYGYEIMKEPPIQHINKKIKELEEELEYYNSFI